MTEVLIIPLKDGKIPSQAEILKQRLLMIEGACNADGTWKEGWKPLLNQCDLIKLELGKWKFIHNVNTLQYSVSASLIKTTGNINLLELNKNDFVVEIKNSNGDNFDLPFRFAMSIYS